MADNVLLTADRNNLEDVLDLAIEHRLGVELMIFAYPDILDGNWRNTVATYRTIVRDVTGLITLHGPFMDMAAGSPDTRISQVVFQRYQHAIRIAAELEINLVVLHANYIGSLHNSTYREGWHKRNVSFWYPLAEIARDSGVTIAVENMWEYEPSIIADLLREINHSHLQACLDVGHTLVFGDKDYTLQDWITTMAPWLVHIHMNNNNGAIDEHYGFDWEQGVLNYHDILPQIRKLTRRPSMVLEMYHVKDMRDSLHHFDLIDQPSTSDSKHNKV